MKQYQNEKAIISLTSWKARIKTAAKTLVNLIQTSKGFHIILVLSEEEFPNKEKDLPEEIKLMIDNDLIEILWVYKNYRSFKKVLFTLDKYRNVPVISADDDCFYTPNYAEVLYQAWLKNKSAVIAGYRNFVFNELYLPNGCGSLYPPYVFKNYGLDLLSDTILNTNNDDMYMGYLLKKMNVPIIYLNKNFTKFHDEIEAMGETGKYSRGIDVLNILKKEIPSLP